MTFKPLGNELYKRHMIIMKLGTYYIVPAWWMMHVSMTSTLIQQSRPRSKV